MNRRHDERGQGRLDEFAALFGHLETLSKQRLRRCRTEANERVRSNEGDLGLEPGTARADFTRIRFRVYPPLTARLPFEVLYYVGHVNRLAIDAGLLQGAIEQLPCRSDERMAGEILGVARLLADEHEARGSRPFAEDCLRPSFVEIAGLTPCGGLSDTV